MILARQRTVHRLLRKYIGPSEAYAFWEYYCKGFARPCRDLRSDDVMPKAKESLLKAIGLQLSEKRNRLIAKITGWPRVGFLKEIFHNAKFIHIVRDGRAVVNSLLQVKYWNGWQGPENWRLGPLPPAFEQEWNQHNRSFIVLSAIYWKILIDAVQDSLSLISPKDFIEIRYEDLCDQPVEIYQNVAEFAELEYCSTFSVAATTSTFANANYKWRRDLSHAQQRILNKVLSDHLQKYRYGLD